MSIFAPEAKVRTCFYLQLILWTSCAQDIEIDPAATPRKMTDTHISLEQAKDNAVDFAMRVRRHARATAKTVTVGNAFGVTAEMNTTRTTTDGINIGDTLFYVINFADDEGFVVAGADTRGEEVYVYVPQGNYAYTPRDVRTSIREGGTGFDEYMRRLKTYTYLTTVDRREYTGSTAPAGSTVTDFYHEIGPLLASEWGQELPYRMYTPHQYPTGCVPTALAQACLFVRKPQSFDGISLDWEAIEEACNKEQFATSSEADVVARFMHHLGVALGAEYAEWGTKAKSKDAIKYLQRMGVSASNLNTYRAHGMDDELLKGNRIVWMRGYDTRVDRHWIQGDDYTGGHAWLADGAVHLRKNGKESEYIHINWGWGSIRHGGGSFYRNGYFSPWVLDANLNNEKPTRSNKDLYYQYQIETSTICRP